MPNCSKTTPYRAPQEHSWGACNIVTVCYPKFNAAPLGGCIDGTEIPMGKPFVLCLDPNECRLLVTVLAQAAADLPPGATHATVARMFLNKIAAYEEVYAYGTGKASVRSHPEA